MRILTLSDGVRLQARRMSMDGQPEGIPSAAFLEIFADARASLRFVIIEDRGINIAVW